MGLRPRCGTLARDGVAPRGRSRRAPPAGAVALAGNLAFWAVRGAAQWWWAASRVVVDTGPGLPGGRVEMIHEFPFFSYLLGDPHAHVLAMPFALLLLGLLWAAASGEVARPLPSSRSGAALPPPRSAGKAAGLALACLLAALSTRPHPGRSYAASSLRAFAGARRFGAGLLLVHGRAGGGTVPLGGLLRLEHTDHTCCRGSSSPGSSSRARPACSARGERGASRSARRRPSSRGPAVALGLVAAGPRPGVHSRRVRRKLDGGGAIAPRPRGLAGLAFLLPPGGSHRAGRPRTARPPRRDGGSALLRAPRSRCSTTPSGTASTPSSKLSYQAVPLLALSGPCGGRSGRGGRGGGSGAARGWAFAGLRTRARAAARSKNGRRVSLDALAHLRREAPAEAALLAWVERNVPPGTRVLQAEGESYRPESVRLSTATGRPALLGWVGHEQQWRGREWGRLAAGRADAIRRLYEGPEGRSPRLLARLAGRCVSFGPRTGAYRLP